jgi:hypothetical protein
MRAFRQTTELSSGYAGKAQLTSTFLFYLNHRSVVGVMVCSCRSLEGNREAWFTRAFTLCWGSGNPGCSCGFLRLASGESVGGWFREVFDGQVVLQLRGYMLARAPYARTSII